jgi:hypothetical protein
MYKNFCPLILIILLLSSCSPTQKNYTPYKKYPKQQIQQDFTLLQNILQKKHPSLYWYTSKDSMDFYFAQYYNAIEDSMTEQQFGWKVVAPLTNKIHCGHTSFGMSKAYNRWIKNRLLPSFPLFFKVWNDTMVVTGNLNLKDSILKRGTIVTGINGLTTAQLKNKLFNYMTMDGYAYNVNYLRLSNNFPYYHRNIFGLSKQYTVNYIDASGTVQTTTVPLFEIKVDSTKKIKKPSVKQPTFTKAERKKRYLQNLRSLAVDTANNTAVITLNTFSSGKLRKFFRQTFRYIKQQGITSTVIDLRSNGGGRITNSTLLTKYVSNKNFKVCDTAYAAKQTLRPYTKYIKWKVLNNIGLLLLSKRKKDGKYHFGAMERKWYKPKTKYHYNNNMYVLISGQTFSASTLFSNAVKGQSNVTIVGEEAGGGWHGNSGVMIPDITLPNTRLRLRLPLVRLVQYKHMPKTGTGLLPDVYVPTSYEALIKGYDRKMQVVMELIQKKKLQN